MRKTLVTISFLCLYGVVFGSFVGVGDSKISKDAKNTKLYSNLKSTMHFSLKNGMVYKGNKIVSTQRTEQSVIYNSVVTYHKGNTIYIIPYKQSTFLSKFKTPGLDK
ncbi:MAG: hypothetical protein HYX40_04875 [Sphingobacteriales bacterium]|nr:hypothetical protein [Sphingobacteriales bacterium]